MFHLESKCVISAQFEFLETHPLIRPMNAYTEFLNTQPQKVPHK